ncbi:MAG: lysophospholipid acyltransferase family protein [Acidimicrobiia bacterium]
MRFGFRAAGRVAAVVSVLLYRLALPARPDFPADTPLLIVVNHRSLLDSVVGFHSFYRWGIEPRFLVQERYFGHPVLKRLLDATGCLPAGSKGSSLTLMRQIRTLYGEGHPVLIMPEGTVVRPPERPDGMGPAQRGVGTIVKMFRPAVLAVGMVGTDDVWPPDRLRPTLRLGRRRPLISIRVGFVEFPPSTDPDELRQVVETTMRALIDEATITNG